MRIREIAEEGTSRKGRAYDYTPGLGDLYMAIAKVNYMTVQLRKLHREGAFKKLKKAKREHDRALDHYVDLAPPVKVTTGTGVIFVENDRPYLKT